MTNAETQVFRRESEIPGTTVLNKGWPDFLVVRDSEIYAIEVKIPTDRVSVYQQRMHAALKRVGLNVRTETVQSPRILTRIERDEVSHKRDCEILADDLWHRLFKLDKERVAIVAELNRIVPALKYNPLRIDYDPR